jgi:hypothetical protein
MTNINADGNQNLPMAYKILLKKLLQKRLSKVLGCDQKGI